MITARIGLVGFFAEVCECACNDIRMHKYVRAVRDMISLSENYSTNR